LTILTAFLRDFWSQLYPLAEDGDLEYRTGPLEFLNDKVSLAIRESPVTDEKTAEGYSWNRWQESRQVGYEKDLKNQWGEIDENKKRSRNENLAEGRISGETFDAVVAKSSREFYENLSEDLDACMDAFTRLDAVADEKFGKDAPRLSELKKVIEDCQQLAGNLLKDKGGRAAAPKPKPEPEKAKKGRPAKGVQEDKMALEPVQAIPAEARQTVAPVVQYAEKGAFEDAIWQEAQGMLDASGIKPALARLLDASGSSDSIRQKNRFRLMMAKLSLLAQRPDIARPIVEELYALIAELGLEKWESPLWIAEVIEAYYLCLTAEGVTEEDRVKAYRELFPKLCSKDITKALLYKKGG
jgi:type VI secretion system protein ImpA